MKASCGEIWDENEQLENYNNGNSRERKSVEIMVEGELVDPVAVFST